MKDRRKRSEKRSKIYKREEREDLRQMRDEKCSGKNEKSSEGMKIIEEEKRQQKII